MLYPFNLIIIKRLVISIYFNPLFITIQKMRMNFINLCTYFVSGVLPTLICLIAPYLPNISYISSDVILYGMFRT